MLLVLVTSEVSAAPSQLFVLIDFRVRIVSTAAVAQL